MNQQIPDYYEANLALLKKHHPATWNQIINHQPVPLGKISFSSMGAPSLTVKSSEGKEIIINSGADSKKESDDFIKRIPVDHKGFVGILGIGLGYHILSVLKERPMIQSLAVFEIEPGIFIQALKLADLSAILADSRVILRVGFETPLKKALVPASRTLQLENSTTLDHFPSFNYNQREYEKLKTELFSHMNSLNIGGATTRKLGEDFLNNRFKHIVTIHHHHLFEQLKNKFSDLPAILVAGGPSLDKNIHLLKQVQNKAVILAVDTVLPTLIKHGVHPHFLTCIDPNNLTFEKVSDIVPKVKDTALICSSWVNPRMPKVFPAAQTFWTFTANPMEAWMNNLVGGKLLTGGASTVAHLNLIAANILGCSPVIFIGQDLAYPQKSSHAKGTVLHGSAPTGVITNNAHAETVKGIDGKLLRTNRAFLSMKAHFETFISNSPKLYINSTEGGAHIEGTKVLPLKASIEQHCKQEIGLLKNLPDLYNTLPGTNPDKMLKAFSKTLAQTKQLAKEIKKADALADSTLKDLTKLKNTGRQLKSFNMLPQNLQKKIGKIDHCHKNLDNTLEIWKILEEITMDGLKESERQRQEIKQIQNDASKYGLWLEKNLERLMEINKIRKKTLNTLATNLNTVIEFHKKEKEYTNRSSTKSEKHQTQVKLARLYMDTKNYYIAKPIIEKLYTEESESDELNFYMGCLATHYAMDNQADIYFDTAVESDPKFSKPISLFRQALGDEFLGFVHYFKTQPDRSASIKYMLFKGLKHCPDHNGLMEELENLLAKNMETILSSMNGHDFQTADDLLREWMTVFDTHSHILNILSPEAVSKIYLQKGKKYLKEKNYAKAIETFKNGLSISPDNPDLHFITIDTFFVANDFNGAIEAINQAVRIDKSFASYWETIGDSLKSGEQYEDAILAYEKAFVNLPENINLLQKIGECYLATNQLEAAKAAFEQLKLMLNGQ